MTAGKYQIIGSADDDNWSDHSPACPLPSAQPGGMMASLRPGEARPAPHQSSKQSRYPLQQDTRTVGVSRSVLQQVSLDLAVRARGSDIGARRFRAWRGSAAGFTYLNCCVGSLIARQQRPGRQDTYSAALYLAAACIHYTPHFLSDLTAPIQIVNSQLLAK